MLIILCSFLLLFRSLKFRSLKFLQANLLGKKIRTVTWDRI